MQERRNSRSILISALLILQLVSSGYSASNITLCHDVPSTWSRTPDVVVLREHNLDDVRMTSALDDVTCWIRKTFHVARKYSIQTKGDNETICYAISTVDLKVGQLLVVVSEGQSAQNCTPSIYGPIPNILNIKMFIDGTKNSSVRRMELAYRNPGGHFGVQFEFHRHTVVTKIQKTIGFFLELNSRSFEYSELTAGAFWKPRIHLPPSDWQWRKLAEARKDLGVPWLLVLSVMPMLTFGIVVSCYIVIQPRGGLTYTDEEVDFQIQEVDSASRVNVIIQPVQNPLSFNTALITNVPLDKTKTTTTTTSSKTSSESDNDDVNTAKEPKDAPKTAIEASYHTDITAPPSSTVGQKSTKTMRLPLAKTTTTATSSDENSVDTMSLKTGKD